MQLSERSQGESISQGNIEGDLEDYVSKVILGGGGEFYSIERDSVTSQESQSRYSSMITRGTAK